MIALLSIRWRAIAIGVAAAGLVAVGWLGNGWRLGQQIVDLKAQRSTEQRNEAYAQVKAVESARLEEQRRTAAQTENTNEAIRQLHAAQASARAAYTARRELLARVTALANAARSPGDSVAVAAGASARDPVLLLADVLGRADQRAGDLAQYADDARVTGLVCERAYDSLKPRAAPH